MIFQLFSPLTTARELRYDVNGDGVITPDEMRLPD